MSEHIQGFLLTLHWRDTAAGTENDVWLATDQGLRHVPLAPQPSVASIRLNNAGKPKRSYATAIRSGCAPLPCTE